MLTLKLLRVVCSLVYPFNASLMSTCCRFMPILNTLCASSSTTGEHTYPLRCYHRQLPFSRIKMHNQGEGGELFMSCSSRSNSGGRSVQMSWQHHGNPSPLHNCTCNYTITLALRAAIRHRSAKKAAFTEQPLNIKHKINYTYTNILLLLRKVIKVTTLSIN